MTVDIKSFISSPLHTVNLGQSTTSQKSQIEGKINGRTVSFGQIDQLPAAEKAARAATKSLNSPQEGSSKSFQLSLPSPKLTKQEGPFEQLADLAQNLKNEKGAMKLQFKNGDFSLEIARNSFFGSKGKSVSSQQVVKQSIDIIQTHLNYENAGQATNTLENLKNDPTIQSVLKRDASLKAKFDELYNETQIVHLTGKNKEDQLKHLSQVTTTEIHHAAKYSLSEKLYAKFCPNLKQQARIGVAFSLSIDQLVKQQPSLKEQAKTLESVIKLTKQALKENDFITAHSLFMGIGDIKYQTEITEKMSLNSQADMQEIMKNFRSKEKSITKFNVAEGDKTPSTILLIGACYALDLQLEGCHIEIERAGMYKDIMQQLQKSPETLKSYIKDKKDKLPQLLQKFDELDDKMAALTIKMEFESDYYKLTENEEHKDNLKLLRKEFNEINKQLNKIGYKISDLNYLDQLANEVLTSPPADLEAAIAEKQTIIDNQHKQKEKIEAKLQNTIFEPFNKWMASINT